ncbi:MAG: hypothetical protein H6Q90_6591, partial [Deltaproteobacteria bacterium]|nr:hypothetical protein [Deltaproteobacteria bacterium]
MTNLAWLALIAACGHSDSSLENAPTPAASPTSAAAPGALPQAFDGIAVGGSFAAVEA